jgi:putative transposase
MASFAIRLTTQSERGMMVTPIAGLVPMSSKNRYLLMARKKRHTEAEIAAKLAEADALAAEGRTQGAIAQSLGISVMTFHRWRKGHPQGLRSKTAGVLETDTPIPMASPSKPEHGNRYAELQLENTRLRRLVTDLLLEKMRLEDEWEQDSGRSTAKKK